MRFEGSQGLAAHRVLYTQQGKTNKESFETEQVLPRFPTQSRGGDGRAVEERALNVPRTEVEFLENARHGAGPR